MTIFLWILVGMVTLLAYAFGLWSMSLYFRTYAFRYVLAGHILLTFALVSTLLAIIKHAA